MDMNNDEIIGQMMFERQACLTTLERLKEQAKSQQADLRHFVDALSSAKKEWPFDQPRHDPDLTVENIRSVLKDIPELQVKLRNIEENLEKMGIQVGGNR